MSLTREDFRRTLPAAVGALPHRWEGDRVTIAADGGQIVITLTDQPARALGSLRLPVLAVEFRFEGFTPDTVAAFMTRFDRHFQRGGG
jgi:hypothetical protein